MHSAAWDDTVDLKDKRVAVVGGGSSAVQIIPSIQPSTKELHVFLRSPVWITAGFGAKHAAPGGVNFDCMSLPPLLFSRQRLTDAPMTQILRSKRTSLPATRPSWTSTVEMLKGNSTKDLPW